ncbi:uncharacterized protein LOC142342100 [Convolutriloba macropyga]|uniref:uncharacterized protein LOC142342100 n=1 Tax=Convolutriloba macropyga TaxID=536237 RepID=UPI003F51CA92
MSPDDDGRSPIILGQVGSGKVTVGDDVTNPLTAGEEYFFYFRTSSFAGLKSNPIEIVKSLPIDTITANNRLVGSTAYFEIRVESGVGSFIRVKFVDDFPKTLEEADTPFSLTLNRQASLTGFVTCATLSLTYYSRGSEQRSKQSNHRLGYPPMTPSAAPGAGLTLFEVHIYDHMAKVRAFFYSYIDSQLRF